MNRAFLLLSLAVPFAPQNSDHLPLQPKLQIVGPSVLMNHNREGAIHIVDLRIKGRCVPGATKNQAARLKSEMIFALGDVETARNWAQKRTLKSVFVVPPHLIEFEAMHDVPQIAPRAASQKVSRDGWPLFDISEAIEFADSRLPGSQRLDYIEFQQGKWSQLPKDRPFIVACRVGHRSQLVTQKLRAAGYDARNLDGGLWEWQVDGLPIEGNLNE